MTKAPTDFFPKEAARQYDEKNKKLTSITECLHFLMGLTLKDLPTRSKILCAGVGTGAEILSLAKLYPEWTFVALDPSAAMLEVCKERVTQAGVVDRCEFVHGYAHDLPVGAEFNACLSILVAHFIPQNERVPFYQALTSRLATGGYLVNAEISFDLESPEFPQMLENWESIQALMGATPESLAMLPKVLNEVLTVLPPAETETLLRQSGIDLPVRFFQAMMICAWFGRKV